MTEELKILANKVKEEIRISKEFQANKKKDIEKLTYDIRYYEGQIDALNLTLTTIEKMIGA
jgi:predicted RNase H-like nuclease (RuvC/YqgF family)